MYTQTAAFYDTIYAARGKAYAREAAAILLGSEVGGYRVRQVLVEERVDIHRELYLSLAIDREDARTRLLASATGGIEIEEIVRDNSSALTSLTILPSEGLPSSRGANSGARLESPVHSCPAWGY